MGRTDQDRKPAGGAGRCDGSFERAAAAQGFTRIAGLDEAGRGCLFGPVYAAVVILDPRRPIRGLNDSKQVPAAERERLAVLIRDQAAAWAVAWAAADEIDRVNIYQASRLAMKRAVEQLSPPPDYLLVDALKLDLPLAQESLVHGDARCESIAAASIIAKVARDAVMREWDRRYPRYGLARNKGYGTAEHLRALKQFGPTPYHRRSFAPVRAAAGASPLAKVVRPPASGSERGLFEEAAGAS